MSSIKEDLSKLPSGATSWWRENAKFRRDNREWLKTSAAIAVKVLAALKTQGLTQNELSERTAVSPQQVNKLVKGQENLTLETISKIETVLEIDIIESSLKDKKAVPV
jgi:ribosome-binding protein aMBF1 (putative translation factor)